MEHFAQATYLMLRTTGACNLYPSSLPPPSTIQIECHFMSTVEIVTVNIMIESELPYSKWIEYCIQILEFSIFTPSQLSETILLY